MMMMMIDIKYVNKLFFCTFLHLKLNF